MLFTRNIFYLLAIVPGLLAVWGNLHGNWQSALTAIFVLGVLSPMEWLTGENRNNRHSATRDTFPELILYAVVMVQTAVWVSLIAGIYLEILKDGWIYVAAVSSGISAGAVGVVTAHELIHKSSTVKRWLGRYLLNSCGNVYFYVHHLRVHHRWVGTTHDAATARKNETVYAFFLRTLAGQFREAWQSEKHLLGKKGKSAWSWENQVFRSLLHQVIIIAALTWTFGITGTAVWFIYWFLAAFLLEYVNYIEHYGLVRQDNEKVNITHSWNSDSLVSRFMLIDLSRHADHHDNASKPYHVLLTHEASPRLPGGYAALIVPALIPPLWKMLVHPRLDKWESS